MKVIRIPEDTHKKLRVLSAQKDMSIQEMANIAILKELSKNHGK